MSDKLYKVNSLSSGAGIIVTYKCSAACLHCCYSSSPRRSGAYMSRQTADKIFPLLKKTGCRSVHIGGGEPFMNFDKLLDVCKSALENKVAIDYIETNASWYTDNKTVSDKLKKLLSVGVDCLLISIDPFHNEFIPYVKIKNLIDCCRKNNMGTFLWQARFESIIEYFDENTTHSLEEYENIFGGDFVKKIAESYSLGYNGRAIKILEKINRNRYSPDYFLRGDNNSCKSRITSLGHFHVDPDENLIPPSCNGFRAGIFDLCINGLDNQKYINFMSVVNNGLEELFDRARTLGFVPDINGYVSKCALCFDIKKYICEEEIKRTGNEPADIGPAGFFDL
ncbi:MAG: radical SAM protein [Oscillospiraceae bacterium]|nr:radical SAM protein [Oscillospiraceae bacterium]